MQFDQFDLQELGYTTVDMDSLLNILEVLNAENGNLDEECNTEESPTQFEREEKASCQPILYEEPPSTTATPNTSILLKQNTIHEAPLPYHEAIKQQQVKVRRHLNTQCRIFKWFILCVTSLHSLEMT